VKEAIARGCDLLLVHHGLFLERHLADHGRDLSKAAHSMENNLAVYGVHLPLDGHLELGNSILLGKALGLDVAWEPFYPYKGFNIGVRAAVSISRDELSERLASALGGKVHLCPGGPAITQQVVLSRVARAQKWRQRRRWDRYLHHWRRAALELHAGGGLGVNLFYGGHYATETFAVKALAEHISAKFGLTWEFVDHRRDYSEKKDCVWRVFEKNRTSPLCHE